jgi:hypothetical protein
MGVFLMQYSKGARAYGYTLRMYEWRRQYKGQADPSTLLFSKMSITFLVAQLSISLT